MQAQLFFHLISKTGCSFPVCCSSLPLKVMKKRLKLPVSIPQARGACLEKQDISTQRATGAGTGGQEKARLHAVRDIQQLHPLGRALFFAFPSFLGVSRILDCQYLVYFGIFTLAQGQHSVADGHLWDEQVRPSPSRSMASNA